MYLPCSTIVEYPRAGIIYAPGQPCTNIYVVIAGIIQVARVADNVPPVIVDVYRTDDFFGEGALIKLPARFEQAQALEKSMLMTWQAADVERLMEQRPSLAMAFMRIMAYRELEFGERMQSMSRNSIASRLARSMLRFSERLGTPTDDGFVHMRGFTHEFLAQYVGTSRELVNVSMTQFRRQDLLKYSRQEIAIRREPFIEWIRTNP
jgi:CRP/FNR family cyclic AMP-dependent transcriptional regulator